MSVKFSSQRGALGCSLSSLANGYGGFWNRQILRNANTFLKTLISFKNKDNTYFFFFATNHYKSIKTELWRPKLKSILPPIKCGLCSHRDFYEFSHIQEEITIGILFCLAHTLTLFSLALLLTSSLNNAHFKSS